MPPSFHVGCLPVRTSDGAAPEDIAQPLVLNWKFDTYIEIEYGYDLNYPYGIYVPHEMMSFSTGQRVQTSAYISTAWGYKLRMSGENQDPTMEVCPAQTT